MLTDLGYDWSISESTSGTFQFRVSVQERK